MHDAPAYARRKFDKREQKKYNSNREMAVISTWFKILTALLVLPVVLAGGAVSVCSCHHEVVYVGQCSCEHGHGHTKHAPQEQDEHRCEHIDNQMQPTSAQVQLPTPDWDAAPLPLAPTFMASMQHLRSLVMLDLARSRLWEPPETINTPLLI